MDPLNQKTIIGNNALISVAGISNIPAKIDTGADTSSIWASNITINAQKQLEFTLFAPESEFYTGEKITVDHFRARMVRNSTGHDQVRYRVDLPVNIKGLEFTTGFTLADRSRNHFPVLIGRRTLEGKFLVDVSEIDVPRRLRPGGALNDELQADPLKFHQKYMQ